MNHTNYLKASLYHLKRFALILGIFSLANLHAVELSQIITNCNNNCNITTNYDKITNSSTFIENKDGIRFNARITEFINYGNITKTTTGNQIFGFESNGYVAHFINYGTIGGSFWISNGAPGMDTFTNYGVLNGGISHEVSNTLTINNFGIIAGRRWSGANINNNNGRVTIQNYTLMINENPTTFNSYTGSDSSAHLVLSGNGVSFKDKNSKILLDFGADFELGKEYAISKVATDQNGNTYTALGVDFSRLSTRNDIYTLSQSGDNFVVSMNPQYGTMGMLYKSNIKTMNNLFLQSNNMIYPHKYKKKKFSANGANLPSNNYRKVRGMSNLFRNAESYAYNSTNPLESNELFFYNNEWLLSRDNANRSVQSSPYNTTYHTNMQSQTNDSPSKSRYTTPKAKPKPCVVYKCVSNPQQPSVAQTQQPQTNAIRPQANTESKPTQIAPQTTQPTQTKPNMLIATNLNDMDCPPLENPCGPYKCIYNINSCKPKPKVEPKIQPKLESKPKVEPKVVEQPKIQPQPKPIQAIRPTMPPPPKVEPKIEQPKPVVQPKVEPKPIPKVEPKVEPKVVKVESPKPTPPKPKVIIQDPYYFILTPYIAHNLFYESGRYNVSGLEYGFITAFSGKITEEHILGLHFAFSYGSLKDSVDSIFNITAMNIMGGLNYKFDIRDDMYLKARVDIFYFLNQVQSTMTSGNTIKPNNLGFGASVAYGKEWDFDRNGILGLEVALDYKGLMGNALSLTSYANTTASYVDSYDKALYNMLYVDLGVNYDKYFESSVGRWGLDTGFGIRGNITANALAKSKVSAHNNARVTNMTLDNDRFIAYLNVGGSYLLERKDFDMEFSLAYYGNFGDRTMSNAGGFEWRVWW